MYLLCSAVVFCSRLLFHGSPARGSLNGSLAVFTMVRGLWRDPSIVTAATVSPFFCFLNVSPACNASLRLTVFCFTQLCALSTIGVAATGLAFGRADQTPSPSPKFARFRRKTPSLSDPPAAKTNAIDSVISGAHPEPSTPSGTTPAGSPARPEPRDAGKPGALNGLHSAEEDLTPRRKPSLFAGVRQRRGQTLTDPPASVAAKEPKFVHVRRPSSAWLKRLSIVPNQGDSRVTSPSPLSPAFNRPASPALSRTQSQRRAPNKLVKRPPSELSHNLHSPSGRSSLPAAASPTFRRPATSYQRYAKSQHRPTYSLNFEPGSSTNAASVQSSTAGKAPEPVYNAASVRPYLRSTLDGLPGRLVRKLSTASAPRDHGLRRIIPPGTGAAPVLVRATSITNRQSPSGTTPASPITPTTPATPASAPVQFRDPFQPIEAPSAERPETAFAPEETKGRQHSVSFDDANTKRDAQNAAAPDAGQRPRGGSLTYPKRRAFSTPLPRLPKSERAISGSCLPNGPRNITDPGAPAGIGGSHRSFLPSPPVPRDFRSAMGSLRDGARRPSTSDSVARSALQSGSFSHQADSNSIVTATRQRPRRHSVAASDPASTVIGSDDTRVFTSGDEDETDFLSDAAFDSIRTHITTTSKTASRRPRVEAIFDNAPAVGSPPSLGLAKLEDLIPRGTFVPRPSVADPFALGIDKAPVPGSLSSISQERTDTRGGESSRLSLLSDLSDDDDDDDDVRSLVAALPGESDGPLFPPKQRSLPWPRREYNLPGPNALSAHNAFKDHDGVRVSSNPYEFRNSSKETLDSAPKMNIFDWSEKPRSDREVSGSEARPQTVHGKRALECRGSRVPGRKAPATLHLRSQSVPGSRDPSISSESRQTSGKFGTWGLGSKGVSEDWDNDFEFDDDDEDDDTFGDKFTEPSKSMIRHGMAVPKAIMDRQASLHGQFGHVKELTLLVEELKRLRHQASVLDLVHGSSNELWKEAEGIVNLATVDEDEANPSPPRSPSSLTFSFDDSEEESTFLRRVSGESWPASISEVSISSNNNNNNNHINKNDNNYTSRDRTCEESSSAKAKSVLDLIYQQRTAAYSDADTPRPKKLPFDTQSLRDLVVRAGVVTRALKEVIRKAEGVSTTPEKDMVAADPPFSRIFGRSSNDEDHAFCGL